MHVGQTKAGRGRKTGSHIGNHHTWWEAFDFIDNVVRCLRQALRVDLQPPVSINCMHKLVEIFSGHVEKRHSHLIEKRHMGVKCFGVRMGHVIS